MSETTAAAAAPSSFLASLGLYDIDWSQLDHAYGPADDTPGHLETLYQASRKKTDTDQKDGTDDDKQATSALYELDGSIAHQGSRYSASEAAVPFVYAILGGAEDESRYRIDILAFLGRLAVGNPEAFIPGGINTVLWRAETATKQAPAWAAEEEQRRNDWVAEAEAAGDETELKRRRLQVMIKHDPEDEARTAAVELGCYDAVRRGLPAVLSFLQLSRENSPAVRSEAVLLLSMFPESPEVEASEKALRELLERETVATVRGSALLALAMLRKKQKGDTSNTNYEAAGGVQKLLEEMHAVAKARWEKDSSDTDAAFEQWCCAAALVMLLGVEEVSTAILVDVVAPLKDDKDVFLKYQPGKQSKEKKDEEDEAKNEHSEDQKEGEGSEDQKQSERNEDKKKEEESESFSFAPLDLDGLCGALLADVKGSAHPEVARAMMGALVQAEGFSALELAHTVLSLAFDGEAPGSSTGTGNKDKLQPPFGQLTVLQQDTVKALTNVSDFCWKYADYKATLKYWGLPNQRDELTAYVEGKAAEEAK
ncbi:hypothetical protein SBRCBS47491_006374 [Sporothrix bragantina]|uniref:Uncharacterized protein n=1 Tax=Sporothrix bragantina TaxID=671064 RepID=A0ABP0C4D2_9PEZI